MKQPNILFILTDDQGAWAMHCAGNTDIITPNLDRLAKRGMRFDNFFCASPVCSPARASILTGQMPSCHGIQDWLCGGNIDTNRYPMPDNYQGARNTDVAIEYLDGHPSYIDELAKQGYRCGLSGKWHMGNSMKPKAGFEKWFALLGGGCNYYKSVFCADDHLIEGDGYVSDIITDHALEMLEDFTASDTPFYLSVHYTAPHSPWEAVEHPDEYLNMYQDCAFTATPNQAIHRHQINTCPHGDTPEHRIENLTGYYAAITAMDANVGRILDYLDASDKADNTIIIFTGDNGMNMGHHGIWGKGNGTYPPNMYDSSVKVPCIISYPAMIAQDVVSDAMLNHCDLFPTLLALAGNGTLIEEHQTGRSFMPLLQGAPFVQKEDIFVCDEYGFVRMLRTRTHKLVANYSLNSWEFYDLVDDPNEDVNRIDHPAYADVIASMKQKLESWFDQYSTPEKDGKHSPLTGRGQRHLCHDDDAFAQDIELYYDSHPSTAE